MYICWADQATAVVHALRASSKTSHRVLGQTVSKHDSALLINMDLQSASAASTLPLSSAAAAVTAPRSVGLRMHQFMRSRNEAADGDHDSGRAQPRAGHHRVGDHFARFRAALWLHQRSRDAMASAARDQLRDDDGGGEAPPAEEQQQQAPAEEQQQQAPAEEQQQQAPAEEQQQQAPAADSGAGGPAAEAPPEFPGEVGRSSIIPSEAPVTSVYIHACLHAMHVQVLTFPDKATRLANRVTRCACHLCW